jgi:hypothetical protein
VGLISAFCCFIFLEDWEIGYRELIRKGIVCGMAAQLKKERYHFIF